MLNLYDFQSLFVMWFLKQSSLKLKKAYLQYALIKSLQTTIWFQRKFAFWFLAYWQQKKFSIHFLLVHHYHAFFKQINLWISKKLFKKQSNCFSFNVFIAACFVLFPNFVRLFITHTCWCSHSLYLVSNSFSEPQLTILLVNAF